jgi:hypothetical protein
MYRGYPVSAVNPLHEQRHFTVTSASSGICGFHRGDYEDCRLMGCYAAGLL